MKYFVVLGIIGISFLSFHLQEIEARTIPQLSIWLDEGTIKQNSFITADGGVPDITIQKGGIVSFPLTVSSHGSESLPVNFFHSIEYAISDTRQSMLPDMKIELDPFHMILKPDEPQLLNVTITALNYTQLGEHKIKLTAQYPQGETLLNTRFDVLVIDENQYENYRFIDFSYANKIGESIQFILEKTSYEFCNSYNAEITDEDGNIVWSEASFALCDPNYNHSLVTAQVKIGYNEDNHIIINESGNYFIKVQIDDGSIQREFVVMQNHGGGNLDSTVYPVPWSISPLKQFESGILIDDIMCKESLILVTKYDGSPTCVKPVTKQHLIERGWAETKSLNEIAVNPDLIKQNIVRIEDGYISLYPENMCASLTLDLPTEQDIQRYKNDENGLNDTNILQITSDDLKEIPNIQELISAVHSIEFPYNKHSSAYLDIVTFVEYEFFLMDKAIKKYEDSKGDYFIQIDSDYEERFADPAKQGFTNHFIAPLIVYNERVYSIDGVHFWTSDEHNPKRMGVYPQDSITDDEKFIILNEEDMKSVPKIKDAIENIGTIKESISARKGLPEDQQNQYREWFEQKSQDRLNSDRFRLIQYGEHLYSIGFSIC
ncbi:hypothetical protein [Nitrosopumilus sp.]|uniref:hypothetical protein n=1 Tax=Nitrosopumilus sp. TaxID=2024843 RepID=UPI0034A007A4